MDEDLDNTEDPVADERFPNIVEFDSALDRVRDGEYFPCAQLSIEEVHDG